VLFHLFWDAPKDRQNRAFWFAAFAPIGENPAISEEVIMNKLEIRRVNGHWFTVKINDNLKIDLSTSKRDKRDWIISKREGVYLEQDKGFVSVWVKKAWSLEEMQSELLSIANEIAESLVGFEAQPLKK